MNPNNPSSSRRSRSRGAGTSQPQPNAGFAQFSQPQPEPYRPQFDDPNSGFAGYGTGYIPQIPNPGYNPGYNTGYNPGYTSQPTYPGNTQFNPGFVSQPTYPGNSQFNPGFVSRPTYPGNTQYPHQQIRELEDSDSSDTPSLVPETQESIPTQSSIPVSQQRGKNTRSYETRRKKQKWTTEEEVALVSAWVDNSENPTIDPFWRSIEKTFYILIGRSGYRTHHALHTKWKALNHKVTLFSGIYNNLVNNRPSGASDVDILQTARSRYHSLQGGPFPHEESWQILRNCQKWATVPPMSTTSSRSSKRSRDAASGSSDAHFGAPEQNDDEDDEPEAVEVMPQPQRPIGRNRAKKAATANRGNTSIDVAGEMSSWKEKEDEKFEYKIKKLEFEQQQFRLKQTMSELHLKEAFERDLDYYGTPHDHLQGMELEVVLAKKARIKQLHNLRF